MLRIEKGKKCREKEMLDFHNSELANKIEDDENEKVLILE